MDYKVAITAIIMGAIMVMGVYSNHVGRDIECLRQVKLTCHQLGVKEVYNIKK